jgi:citrate synthase
MAAGCFCWLAQRPFTWQRKGESIAGYALRAAGAPVSSVRARALEGALIVLADNALAPATSAARILASTGVGLNGCISAALCSNESAGMGQVFRVGEAMAKELLKGSLKTDSALRDYASRMLANQVNKRGDGRVRVLLDMARLSAGPAFLKAFETLEKVREQTGVQPNLNVALGLLTHSLGLPQGSSSLVWMLGRMAGWCGHITEQSEKNRPSKMLVR